MYKKFILIISLLFTTACHIGPVYCHYNDPDLIRPWHFKAKRYEVDNEYYKFYMKDGVMELESKNCTLFYSTYCPVCKKDI